MQHVLLVCSFSCNSVFLHLITVLKACIVSSKKLPSFFFTSFHLGFCIHLNYWH